MRNLTTRYRRFSQTFRSRDLGTSTKQRNKRSRLFLSHVRIHSLLYPISSIIKAYTIESVNGLNISSCSSPIQFLCEKSSFVVNSWYIYYHEMEHPQPKTEPVRSYDDSILRIQREQLTTPETETETTTENEYVIEPQDELLIHNYYTLPDNCRKFWRKRYKLFSRFDDGVYMSSDMWFSVTPEAMALFTARLVRQMLPEAKYILDVCCGAGGNAIQLAYEFPHVVAIDINQSNIISTIHNAGIYGVRERIWCIQGDWTQMAQSTDWLNQSIPHIESTDDDSQTFPFDFVFSSPPWGGNDYLRSLYDLSLLQPLPLRDLLLLLSRFATNFGLFLPRLLDTSQLSETTKDLFGPLAKCRIVYPYEGEYISGILAFWGPDVTKERVGYELFVDSDYLILNSPLFTVE